MNHLPLPKTKQSVTVLLTALLLCTLAGCGPSQKEIQEAADRKAKEALASRIEELSVKVRDNSRDPVTTQLRYTKLLANGTILCGEVNAKNGYGGYMGFKPFAFNENGKLLVINQFAQSDIKGLASKTLEERKTYVKDISLQFSRLGQMQTAALISVEHDQMENFGFSDFSMWAACVATS